MKFAITLELMGTHQATITLDTRDDLPSVTGSINSADYGEGSFTGSRSAKTISGSLMLDGYSAKFAATLSEAEDSISGSISYGWMFSGDFSGKLVPDEAGVAK